MNTKTLSINNFVATVRRLRSETGCPWDKRQTPESLCKYLLEEVAELVEAIDNKDSDNICEEIGDVFYILIMLAEIHAERGDFTFDRCLEEINSKLIRRHPHVFAGTKVESETELRRQWQKIKEEEKKRNN